MPRTTVKSADVSGNKLFWVVASAIVIGQLVAFWMLCSHQVHKAEMRTAAAKVERLAVADCLLNIPGATLGNCAASAAAGRDPAAVTVAQDQATAPAGATPARMSAVVPVNLAYR